MPVIIVTLPSSSRSFVSAVAQTTRAMGRHRKRKTKEKARKKAPVKWTPAKITRRNVGRPRGSTGSRKNSKAALSACGGDPRLAAAFVDTLLCNPDISLASNQEFERADKRTKQSRQKKKKKQYIKDYVKKRSNDLMKASWLNQFAHLTISARLAEQQRLAMT